MARRRQPTLNTPFASWRDIDLRQPLTDHPLNQGRVAWWKVLPQWRGSNTFRDLRGKHHGTLTDGPTWTGPKGAAGQWGGVELTATSQSVLAPAAPWDTLTERISLEAIVRYSSVSGTAFTVGKTLGGGMVPWAILHLPESSGRLSFGFYNGSWQLALDPSSTPTDRALHLVGTYDRQNLRLYVDGQEVGNQAATAALPTNSDPLRAGSAWIIGQLFTLYGMSVWPQTLSADAVHELYDQSQRFYPDLLRRVRRVAYSVPEAAPGGFVDLAGTITGASTVSGSLAVSRSLTGTVAGTSTVSGTLETAATHDLAGTITGTSSLAGTLARSLPLAGTATGTATVTGTLAVTRSLAGTTAGQSTLPGTLETTAVVTLAGTVSGQSTVSGSLAVSRLLTSTTTGTGSVTGSLEVTRSLAGQTDGTGTVAGSLAVSRPLAGTLTGSSTVTGSLSTAATVDLAGTVAGTSSVSAGIERHVGLRGTVAGTGAVTSSLARLRSLAGTIAGQASLAGSLALTRRLAGTIGGLGVVSSRLAVLRLLAGTVAGQGTLTADLTGGVRRLPSITRDRIVRQTPIRDRIVLEGRD